ncbi:unnamed protein product [Effrenium voratum]|uniref:Ammonium transporter AmtB-like domain-containing protein n=1 Tax=Effrenium voratum TaxID=2562239 RepID=A0AA36IVB8_9DINO|nr:unnamed protein product [Effrenium voratum]
MDQGLAGALDSAWLCLCGALVMFMHAGFAMLETGCCRAKNASNVLMKNLVNVCVGTLGWWSLGWAFAYGAQNGNGFIGTTGFFGWDFYSQDATTGVITPVTCNGEGCQSTMLSWFFQWAFCTAGATIVSGAVAERVKSPTYAAYAFFMTSFIYPVVVAWTWGGGWIASVLDVGYMDFAGSGVVHLTGGVSGLAGTIVLGPRKGRFVNPEEFEPHNLPLVVLGTFALWFGWYGFNPGSTLGMHDGATGALAAQVAMNTTLAAATGGITVFILRFAILRKYDVGGLCNGILAGLVSITAGCGNMECGSAFATGRLAARSLHAAPEAEDRRPRGRRAGARLLRHVGLHCLRPLRLGQGRGPLPRLERLGLHANRGREQLQDGHRRHCHRRAVHHDHHDHPLGRHPVHDRLLGAEAHRHAAHQRGGGGCWHGLAPPLPAEGLRLGSSTREGDGDGDERGHHGLRF